jgi:hypothetical protein
MLCLAVVSKFRRIVVQAPRLRRATAFVASQIQHEVLRQARIVPGGPSDGIFTARRCGMRPRIPSCSRRKKRRLRHYRVDDGSTQHGHAFLGQMIDVKRDVTATPNENLRGTHLAFSRRLFTIQPLLNPHSTLIFVRSALRLRRLGVRLPPGALVLFVDASRRRCVASTSRGWFREHRLPFCAVPSRSRRTEVIGMSLPSANFGRPSKWASHCWPAASCRARIVDLSSMTRLLFAAGPVLRPPQSGLDRATLARSRR